MKDIRAARKRYNKGRAGGRPTLGSGSSSRNRAGPPWTVGLNDGRLKFNDVEASNTSKVEVVKESLEAKKIVKQSI